MNRKNGIDLFRLIASFFIMCLHTGSYGSLDATYVNDIRLLSRWALPFFFITTGYFLGNKITGNTLAFSQIQKSVSTLISLLIITTVIYLPINIWFGNVPESIPAILKGSYLHLWFIGSSLVGYIFIWHLSHIKKIRFLPYLSVLMLLLALIADSYDQLLHKQIDFEPFRYLLSVPLMYIGILIQKQNDRFNNMNLIIAALILIGIIVQFTESNLLFKYYKYNQSLHQILIGTLVYSIALFIFSSKLELSDNVFSKLGRKYSLAIYLYHPVVYFILPIIILKTIPGYYNFIQIFSPITGFTITLFTLIILNRYFPRIFNFLNGNIGSMP